MRCSFMLSGRCGKEWMVSLEVFHDEYTGEFVVVLRSPIHSWILFAVWLWLLNKLLYIYSKQMGLHSFLMPNTNV